MNALEALQGSKIQTIRARFESGVAVIHESTASTGAFHARVIFRDAEGDLDMARMEMLGDFEDLADAVAAVEKRTGTKIAHWIPETGTDLHRTDTGAKRPTGTDHF